MEWSGKVVFGLLLQGRVDEMEAIVTASVSGCNLQETNFFSFGFSPLSSASFLPLCFSSADVWNFCTRRRSPISKGQKKPHQQGVKKSTFMFPLWWCGFTFMEGFPESAMAVLNFSWSWLVTGMAKWLEVELMVLKGTANFGCHRRDCYSL